MVSEESGEIVFEARGAVAELFELTSEACNGTPLPEPHEVLLEGPAGTGKTRGAEEWAYFLLQEFPGCRILFARATRASMNESVLQIWEDHVLGATHEVLRGRPMTRGHRDYYEFPYSKVTGMDGVTREGKSRVVVGGLDNPDRIMSTEYDVAILFEATEVGLDGVEKVISRLRGRNMPFTLLVNDCNPAQKSHHLNRRASRGLMRRFLSRHQDNPVLWDRDTKDWTEFWKINYSKKLESLTAHRKKRLLYGDWVSAEGLILEEYNPDVHHLQGELVRDPAGSLIRSGAGNPILKVDSWNGKEIEMRWFFASQDWGYRAPGSLSIWGVDRDERMFQVYQVYHTGRQIQWWARFAADFHRELGLRAIVCDHDEDNISVYNDHLSKVGDRARIAIKARKGKGSWTASTDMVRWGLTGRHPETSMNTLEQGPLPPYQPRMFLMQNNLVPGADPLLVEKGLPCGTAEELEGLVWKQVTNPERQEAKDEPDPGSPDHGFDDLRYGFTWKWKRKGLTSTTASPRFRRGSMGAWLGHSDVLRESWKRGR